MCNDCFEQEYYGFPTYKDFDDFETILDSKCRSQKIEILESQNEKSKEIIDFHMYFQCNSCSEKFVLSLPENAFRGYFLTEKNAVSYHKKLRSSDKNKKNGGLVILLILFSLLIYFLFKN